jgi:hypothetical protein
MEFLVFMHGDATSPETGDWDQYIGGLMADGVFCGGSSLSPGASLRLQGDPAPTSAPVGFIRLKCRDLDQARELVAQNPAFLAGASIEIFPLVEDE